MSAIEFPKFCILWGHTESCTSGKNIIESFLIHAVDISTCIHPDHQVMVVGPLGMVRYGKFEVLSLIEFSSVGLNMINHLKHIYPWRWIGLSDSIFINVGVIITLRALNRVSSLGDCFLALALWKCLILWQSLHLAFLAGNLCPSWCSCFPHLMHLSSIPGGFLD